LSVGQRVFRLVGQGSFKMPKEWKPVIEDADSALAQSSPVAMEHP